MGQHLGLRIASLHLENLLGGKLFVHLTGSVPDHHIFPPRNPLNIATEITIRREDDFLCFGQRTDHLDRIAGCTTNIRQGLHPNRRIHIGYHRMVGILLQKFGKSIRRTGVGQRTPGFGFGQQHLLLRSEDLCGLGHKMDAREEQDRRIRFSSLCRKRQTIPGKVGDLLDFGQGIVMGQDDGVFLSFQCTDSFHPLFYRNGALGRDAVILVVHVFVCFYFQF